MVPRCNYECHDELQLPHAYSAYPNTEMYQRIDSILISEAQPCMLIQSSTVLVGNTTTVLNVKRDHAHFVGVSTQARQGRSQSGYLNTDMTSWLSSKGTISSTRVFGVFPSAVSPVAQH